MYVFWIGFFPLFFPPTGDSCACGRFINMSCWLVAKTHTHTHTEFLVTTCFQLFSLNWQLKSPLIYTCSLHPQPFSDFLKFTMLHQQHFFFFTQQVYIVGSVKARYQGEAAHETLVKTRITFGSHGGFVSWDNIINVPNTITIITSDIITI